MPKSLGFVGPRRLWRVFKEYKLFGLKTSWEQSPKEGHLPGQGAGCPSSAHRVRELCGQRALQGIRRTYKWLQERASIWTPEAHPWILDKKPWSTSPSSKTHLFNFIFFKKTDGYLSKFQFQFCTITKNFAMTIVLLIFFASLPIFFPWEKFIIAERLGKVCVFSFFLSSFFLSF